MAKHLLKFNNEAEYNAATINKPAVSWCVEENTVKYDRYIPAPTPSHDYVEIGGIKWATMNVGAESITDTGLYFQWGDTSGYTAAQVGSGEGKKYFGWTDYKYGGDDNGGQTKYNSTDGKTVLDLEDDAVNAAWGGNWRMPTTAELRTLSASTTSAWTADYEGSGVAGLVLTSKADSNIKLFFPTAGSCGYGSVSDVGDLSFYWSSSLVTIGSGTRSSAYGLTTFFDSEVMWRSQGARQMGCNVRGVLDSAS